VRSSPLVLAALLAVAVLVRVSAMFYGSLSGDDATVALMAKHVLHGENFPVFFYRQTYMGAPNGLHLVPALFVFGPSALVVRLNAIAWSLLFPLGIYLLGRRVFGEGAGRAALALAAVPPFLLTYWSTVAEPHFETNVFGVWLLLLTLAALTAPSEAARTRALAAFGLLAGVAWWSSFKVIEILGPALALLVFRSPRRALGRQGALVAGGFLLGSLPAWLFYGLHGDSARGTPGSAVPFFHVALNLSVDRLSDFWEHAVLELLGRFYWHPTTPLRRLALALNVALYAAAVGLAVLQALRRRRRGDPATARDWGLWLVLLVLPAAFGALYFSPLAADLERDSSRYILPAYIPLFVCAGALVARAGRWSRTLGAGLLAFLLAFALWTHAGFLWPLSPALRAQQAGQRAALEAVRQSLSTRPVDALYVDDSLQALVWAFLLDHPIVSALDSEIYLPSAEAADAAERIAILARGGEAASSLAALGATWRVTPIGGGRLYEDVRVPARGYRLVPRHGWRVPDDPAAPAAIADGDLATAWPAIEHARGSADALVVDLGRRYDVARVIFWPSVPTSYVFPLRLSGREEGGPWESLGVTPVVSRQPAFVAMGRPVFRPRNGWLEVAVSPRRLRYLRLEPTEPVGEAPWGITELRVYEETLEPPAAPTRVDGGDGLVARLRAQGVSRLLADPVASARVARATQGAVATLVANGVVDNHGAAPPAWLARPVRLRAHDGLLVPVEDAPELQERLEAAGLELFTEPLGAHVLFRVLKPFASTAPCQRPSRRAAAMDAGGGDRVVLEADLPEEALVSGLKFRHPVPAPELSILEVTLSRDGRTWQSADGGRTVPDWAWAGRTLFAVSDGAMELVFGSAPARHVRVAVTRAGSASLAVLCVRGTPAR
jgi:4-amino-4-deoxy-L-arabinose transferase-like glycosyltransferase